MNVTSTIKSLKGSACGRCALSEISTGTFASVPMVALAPQRGAMEEAANKSANPLQQEFIRQPNQKQPIPPRSFGSNAWRFCSLLDVERQIKARFGLLSGGEDFLKDFEVVNNPFGQFIWIFAAERFHFWIDLNRFTVSQSGQGSSYGFEPI